MGFMSTSLCALQESRKLFNILVGAAFAERGLEVATNWINSLVNPLLQPAAADGEAGS